MTTQTFDLLRRVAEEMDEPEIMRLLVSIMGIYACQTGARIAAIEGINTDPILVGDATAEVVVANFRKYWADYAAQFSAAIADQGRPN